MAIALRSNIKCRLLPIRQLKLIEPVEVEVTTSVGVITLIVAYCPKQAKEIDGTSATLHRDIMGKLKKQSELHNIE